MQLLAERVDIRTQGLDLRLRVRGFTGLVRERPSAGTCCLLRATPLPGSHPACAVGRAAPRWAQGWAQGDGAARAARPCHAAAERQRTEGEGRADLSHARAATDLARPGGRGCLEWKAGAEGHAPCAAGAVPAGGEAQREQFPRQPCNWSPVQYW
jgi:hypothetical protein